MIKNLRMELPTQIKDLYRHWDRHVLPVREPAADPGSVLASPLSMEILSFVRERVEIWKHKQSGEVPPYTTDPILSRYRFCNILRELDRQTMEFHTLLNPLRDDFSLWLLNMFYCRMIARTETIRLTGPLSFDAQENHAVYERLMASPRPRFGTAYVFPTSTIQRSSMPTRERFLTEHLSRVMRPIAQRIEGWNKKSVYDGVAEIIPLFGFSHAFLWTEVLIDTAYQFPKRLDLFKQFPVGPGALPTMRRLDSRREPSELVADLAVHCVPLDLTYEGRPIVLSAENWEGIGCEFRKYTNLKNGHGRKRLFRQASGIH